MRFPFRLSAALLKAKLARLIGASSSPVIFHTAPDSECVARIANISAPVVWLEGGDLLYAEIGRVANRVVELNRRVFVHADGYNLRQRIHEFRPDSRLFLTLEFAGREEAHNRAAGRTDAFRRSLEGIRAAKLSGFLVAAHVSVTSETDACDIGELIEFLDKMDVDGFIVSSRGLSLVDHNAQLGEDLADVRNMIRSGRWENFSRLLEASYADKSPGRTTGKIRATAENAFEEAD